MVKTPENTGRIASDMVALLGPDRLPNGVCVADGYGLSISVERRHLIIRDGAGSQRRAVCNFYLRKACISIAAPAQPRLVGATSAGYKLH